MSKNKKGSGNGGPNEPWNRIDPSAASDADIQRVHDELAHDKETPREGFSPIPILLVFLLSALVVFSGIYMVWRSDDFDPMGYDETRRRFAWEATEGHAKVDPILQTGQKVYMQCAACHQQDGQGLPGAFPPLDGTRWVLGNEERLIRVVLHGLTGPIEVAGQEFNSTMPAQGPQLDDEEVAAVLTYIRQAWSNDARPIEPDEVARVRGELGGDLSPKAPADLLEQFPLEDPAELEASGGDAESAEETEEAAEEE